jgi:hypothetical protein
MTGPKMNPAEACKPGAGKMRAVKAINDKLASTVKIARSVVER